MFRRPPEPAAVAEIVSPRVLEESTAAARGMLAALAADTFSLEVVTTAAGPRWFVRAGTEQDLSRILAQVQVAYPQAVIEPATDAPGIDRADTTVAVPLRAATDPGLPLRFDWRRDRDPLAGVVGAVEPGDGERVICRLDLAPAPRDAAERIRRREERPARASERPYSGSSASLTPLVAFMALAVVGFRAWQWYEEGAWALLAAAGVAVFVAVPLLGAVAMRLLRGAEPIPRQVVAAKVGAPLFTARLAVLAVGSDRDRSRALAMHMAAAYAAYDDAAGGGLKPAKRRADHGRRGAPTLLLNAAEAAALWHLPDAVGAPPSVRRTGASRLAPVPGHADSGIRVGQAPSGRARVPAYLPHPLIHRNHFIVAKTRRGKSTLLRHMASGLMERMASGVEDAALVVVDPHRDLAEAVLASVPDALLDRAVYLDLAHPERPVGLNLLDVELFPDRDRAVESIVTIMNRLWPANWGPRMEGALRASLASLHELNGKRSRVEQYTLLDVAPMLMDDGFRGGLLKDVEDPALAAWWRDNYTLAGRVLQQQTANPVTSKIGRFTVTEASRLVVGQSRSTFDPRQVIRDGGILVVNTAVGTLGEGASSLVGATLLNLLGLLIEEQIELPPEQRHRVVALIDESSTLGAVDYTRMLSELAKFGAAFTLVTQSLAKLDAIDRQLLPTILSNADALTAFQCSAEDARRLVPELGSGIEVEDLVSLPDFSAYVRWWDGATRPPAFTLTVDAPPPLDFDRVAEVARRSAERHGRPRDVVVEEVRRVLAERSRPIPSRQPTPPKKQDKQKQAGQSGKATAPTGKVDTNVAAASAEGTESS